MKTLKKAIAIVFILILAFLVFGLFLPKTWKVERSTLIKAPTSVIYPYLANLRDGWPQWSAFDRTDPEIIYTYSGPEMGVGSSRAWISKKMGNGTQKIVAANPQTGVEYELQMKESDFLLRGKLILQPEGKDTKVTWVDAGEVGMNPMHRYFARLMDKMMGPAFEESLRLLKEKVENPPKKLNTAP